MRYGIIKEQTPGQKDFMQTGEVFVSVADSNGSYGNDAITHAEQLQEADTSGCAYSVALIGP